MDPMVSARVPIGLRDAVNEQLKAAGSSPTALINSAYEYFLETKELPKSKQTPKAGSRVVTPAIKQEVDSFLDAIYLSLPADIFEEKTDKELLAEALREDYESLS